MGASWHRMHDEMPAQGSLMLAFVESIGPSVRSAELREKLAEHYQRTRIEDAAAARDSLGPDATADPEIVASFLIDVHDGFMVQFLVDPARVPSAEQLTSALGAALTAALQT